MSIAFQCERCGKDFEVEDRLAGKNCRCKQCGHQFLIPGSSQSPPSFVAASRSHGRSDGQVGSWSNPQASSAPAAASHPAPAGVVAFHCTRCGKSFEVDRKLVGRQCKCKQCGHVFAIPNGRPAAVAGAGYATEPPREWLDEDEVPQRPSRPARARPSRGDDDSDEPWQKMPPSGEPDIGELLPQRAKYSTPKRAKRPKAGKARPAGKAGKAGFSSMPIWVFLVGAFFGFILARQVWMRNSPDLNPVWIGLAFLAYTMSASGGFACLVVAFREGPSYGLCCLFIPLYIFFYIFSRWEHTKEGFAVSFIGGMLISGATAINPDLRLDEYERFAFSGEKAAAPAPPEVVPPPRAGRPPVPALPHAGWGRPDVARITPAPTPAPRNAQPQPRVLLADFTDQALSDLKSGGPHVQKMALHRLSNAPPNDRRAEVARAVEPLLKDPDGFVRAEAAKTLGIWGDPESVPALLTMLKDPAFNVRWAVLDALKERRDPKSAEALADYLMNSNDRGKAADALKAIGAPAEDAVLPCLKHHDGFVRMDGCKILGAIGTSKSIPALRQIAQRGHGLDVMAAREALNHLDPNSFR